MGLDLGFRIWFVWPRQTKLALRIATLFFCPLVTIFAEIGVPFKIIRECPMMLVIFHLIPLRAASPVIKSFSRDNWLKLFSHGR